MALLQGWVDGHGVATGEWKRGLLVLALFVVATGLNFYLQPLTDGRSPLLPYYPALVVAALSAGFVPALALLLGALVATQAFWTEPSGVFWQVAKVGDRFTLLFFLFSGLLVIAAGAWARALVLKLEQAQDKLQMALDAGKMASWSWDLRTDKLTFFGNAREVLGTPSLPQRMSDGWPMVQAQDRVHAQSEVEAAIASGRPFKELTRIGAAAQPRWVETHGRVTRAKDGKPRHVHAVMVDVTDRQTALMASQAAQTCLKEEIGRKDTFVATLAHELRNPLAPIRYAVAMLGEGSSPAHRRRAQEVITRQAAHMARLLDDLLDLSRITRNAVELQRDAVDLREIARAAVDIARPAAEGGRKRLSLALPEEAVWVHGDQTRLEQIANNLLNNALKFTDPGGRVQVCVEAQGEQALMRFRDSGAGIAPDFQREIFELFTQVDQPGQGKGGLGIGLNVVKRLAELHGGSVSVYSEGPGMGSEFTVGLPRMNPPVVHPASPAPQEHKLSPSARVLIVDDSCDSADMLAAFARDQGLATQVAYNGADALRTFTSFQPCAVVLDLGLPDMHGIDVARRIRALPMGTRARIFAVTGWGQDKDRFSTAEAGFDGHFVKPVDPTELMAQLQRAAGEFTGQAVSSGPA